MCSQLLKLLSYNLYEKDSSIEQKKLIDKILYEITIGAEEMQHTALQVSSHSHTEIRTETEEGEKICVINNIGTLSSIEMNRSLDLIMWVK